MLSQNEMHKHTGKLDIAQKINNYITYLMTINLLTFILGIITYGDKYLFREYAFSYLGGIRTINGNPNTTSFLIFSLGMISCGVICFYLSRLLNGENELELEKTKHYLFQACCVGYFNSPLQQHIQKYAVFGLILIMKLAIMESVKVYQKSKEQF
ncbi:MAG: hypothetical protein GH151_08345 [Bacteroidetes bacterium]|nr:hypothetical protein [Bacteroidota bacterium]